MILEQLGRAHRSFRNVPFVRRLALGFLNPALDFADIVEILGQARPVARIEPGLKPAGFLREV
jgi:hypothetical protein